MSQPIRQIIVDYYDLAFLRWFESHGWRVHRFLGNIDVWSNDDTPCPFEVTSGMIARLVSAGMLVRFWPEDAGFLDEFWGLPRNH